MHGAKLKAADLQISQSVDDEILASMQVRLHALALHHITGSGDVDKAPDDGSQQDSLSSLT